jgi:cell division protein FtsA
MDTRIGYPNEHLAGNSGDEISSPLFATAVGLVMNSVANNTQSAYKLQASIVETPQSTITREAPSLEIQDEPEVTNEAHEETPVVKPVKKGPEINESFMDKILGRVKDFLDNAE